MRVYTVAFTAVAVTAAVDVWEITAADDKPVQILGFVLGQSSDAGDSQAEQIGYRIIRGFTTSGSGGASVTPAPLLPADTAAGFAAETNNTTVATTGTTVDLVDDVINVQAGEKVWFPEGLEPTTNQGAGMLVVRLAAAPADSLTMHGTLYVREIG